MRKINLIAEPANYWHGDEEILKDTLLHAAACQVDFFKVQLSNPERLGNPWQPKKKVVEACEIKESLLREIKQECDRYGINVLATVNNADRVELCRNQNVTNVKIASGQIHPLLIDAIKSHEWERVFISTGMLEEAGILSLLEGLEKCCSELVIMHCVSLYPTYDPEINISRISSLRWFFTDADIEVTMGYSDHHLDDLPCFLAVGQGARYIERHFKIEDSFGPTSEICLGPKEMGNFSGLCKRMSVMWGNGELPMQPREKYSHAHYKTRYII